MAKDITSTMRTELSKASIRPRILFEGDFGTIVLRYWTGIQTLSWDSRTWLGTGYIKAFSSYRESSDLGAEEMQIDLVGTASSLISLMENHNKHKYTGSFYFACVDSSDQIIADPFLIFKGRLNSIDLIDNPKDPSISLVYSTQLKALSRSKDFRYNQATQHLFFSSDAGFEYMEQLSKTWQGYWGKKVKPQKKAAA